MQIDHFSAVLGILENILNLSAIIMIVITLVPSPLTKISVSASQNQCIIWKVCGSKEKVRVLLKLEQGMVTKGNMAKYSIKGEFFKRQSFVPILRMPVYVGPFWQNWILRCQGTFAMTLRHLFWSMNKPLKHPLNIIIVYITYVYVYSPCDPNASPILLKLLSTYFYQCHIPLLSKA